MKKIHSILMTLIVLAMITAVSYASPPAASNTATVANISDNVNITEPVVAELNITEDANITKAVKMEVPPLIATSNANNEVAVIANAQRIQGTDANEAENSKAQTPINLSVANLTENNVAGVDIDGSMVQIK